MFEKVNPSHPDKVADRIAGAIVDLAYANEENPKIAVEVLIGHGICHAIIETTADLNKNKIKSAIKHIAGNVKCDTRQRSKIYRDCETQRSYIECYLQRSKTENSKLSTMLTEV